MILIGLVSVVDNSLPNSVDTDSIEIVTERKTLVLITIAMKQLSVYPTSYRCVSLVEIRMYMLLLYCPPTPPHPRKMCLENMKQPYGCTYV